MFVVILFVTLCIFQGSNGVNRNNNDLIDDLKLMNSELGKLNSLTGYVSWKLSTVPSEEFTLKLFKIGGIQINWREKWCDRLKNYFFIKKKTMDFDNFYEFRQFYLLCRGPYYNLKESRKLMKVLGELQTIYETSEVCISDGSCLRGEPDLERIMAKSRDPSVLYWAWVEWRNKVGPPSRTVYPIMVNLLNRGARNGGYNEIGECWREELEMENLEDVVENLYNEIEPLYKALHAVVRFKLNEFYGSDLISLDEPLPAHLLGNMWAQNWGSLLDIITDFKKEESLTYYLQKRNFTVVDLVKKAEDFYVSLGFKPMTRAFWKYSKFKENAENGSTCHGTAANMFQPGDYRIILCAEITEEDFSVIHHEMGHVAYYMEYENLPAIFQDGVNSAFQESIGDAIMFGVTSPPHLNRLGLLKEINNNPDLEIKLLLYQGLNKIPQIPYALLLEKWRWNVFKGEISPLNYNSAWWELREKYQGVKSPARRSEKNFDPSAKFHINDNKPYIRYFLSSILQMQLFEAMCKASIYGNDYFNKTLPIPLHKCDIYGSTTATKNLRKMMSLGSSITWKEALKMVTGTNEYSARPLLQYYQPLYEWLLRMIKNYNIPVGWTKI